MGREGPKLRQHARKRGAEVRFQRVGGQIPVNVIQEEVRADAISLCPPRNRGPNGHDLARHVGAGDDVWSVFDA